MVTTTLNFWRQCTTSQHIASHAALCRLNSASATAFGSDSGGSVARVYSRPSFNCSPNTARLLILCSSSTARLPAPVSRPPGQKRAARAGLRPLTRRLLDQGPPQDRFRRPPARRPPDRWRGQRQYPIRDLARYRTRYPLSNRHYRQGLRQCCQSPRRPQTRHRAGHPTPRKFQAKSPILPKTPLSPRARIK